MSDCELEILAYRHLEIVEVLGSHWFRARLWFRPVRFKRTKERHIEGILRILVGMRSDIGSSKDLRNNSSK